MSAPLTRRVTIRDVAAAAGVSTATVSRVLTGEPGIGPTTTALVLETSKRLQYRPSAAARRLRTRSSSLLGVVVQSVGDGYVGEVVLGIQRRARDHGFRPLFVVSEGQARLEAEAVDVFLSEQVQEFICVSPTQQPHILRRAVENGFHVSVVNWDPRVSASVFEDIEHGAAKNTGRFGSHSVERSIWEVKFDDLGAAILATNHLLELGHRKLAHLRGPDVRSSLLRLLGYRRALEAAALWPQTVITAEDSVLEKRELALVAYLRRQRPPLGIVAYDDLAAVATLPRRAHSRLESPRGSLRDRDRRHPFCRLHEPGPDVGCAAEARARCTRGRPGPRRRRHLSQYTGTRRASCRPAVDSPSV